MSLIDDVINYKKQVGIMKSQLKPEKKDRSEEYLYINFYLNHDVIGKFITCQSELL